MIAVTDYLSYQFLYPPRPRRRIFKLQLPNFEAQGYWSQYKKNGTNNVIAISPDRQIIARQRHNIPHERWTASEHTVDAFRRLKGGWFVFIAELLHSKVRDVRDINYINDILVADSRFLTGTSFAERQALLATLFNAKRLPVAATGSHFVIDRHTWLARNHKTGFSGLFAGLSAPEDEGLVLKFPHAILASCRRPDLNASWMVKIRRPTATRDA